jgi:hypothetical protein
MCSLMFVQVCELEIGTLLEIAAEIELSVTQYKAKTKLSACPVKGNNANDLENNE